MKKIFLLIFIFLIGFGLIFSGCSVNTNNTSSNIIDSKKTKTNAQIQNTQLTSIKQKTTKVKTKSS